MMILRCWHRFAYPEDRCQREARWKSPPHLCIGIGGEFMSKCVWCDEHRHQDDVPINNVRDAMAHQK